jgi:hypothetical protein
MSKQCTTSAGLCRSIPGDCRFHATGWRHWATLCGLAAALVAAWPLSSLAETPVLKWGGAEKDPHPCLYVTARDVARAKADRKDVAALAALKNFRTDRMDELVAAVLLAANPDAEKAATGAALKALDDLIKAIPTTTDNNVGPHAYARTFGQAAGLADAALASKTITAEERASMLAKIAQASYMMNDPRYFNPDAPHGSMCLNMFTSAAGYRLTLAALLPSHPKAKEWFDGALAELKQELEDWVDLQGGMAECPHYAMVIFDQWVGSFLIARNAGAPEAGQLFNPKLRKAIEWFGNISTPRDSMNSGFRRLPSLGHTYHNERTGMFGVMACLWKDKDPAIAAQMQWMHLEHGSFGEPGILSYYPSFMGYRSFFKESGVAPKAPAWASQYYQEAGVQLRNTIGSDRETTLYMIAGRFHSHYYNDSGSITLWGKGRELCGDDNYQFKHAKESREAHSMIDKPATFNEERVMEIKEFSSSRDLDYVSGVRRGWTRQIAFVKDTDPLAPNYFVIADTVDAKSAPTVWRLFLNAREVTPTPNGVTVVGKEDVDMDIVFLRPSNVKVQIHAETHPPTAYSKEPIVVHHIAVAVEQASTVTAVLYPRLKTEKPPVVTPVAGGQGVKVVTPAGTDIVYLNPEPVKAEAGGKAFEGKVCLVKERNGKAIQILPGACDVARDFWPEGDPQLRKIHWKKGPQYPNFPDYEEAVTPNAGNDLILDQQKPATVTGFSAALTLAAPRQATEVAVNWDEKTLDVAFTCADNGIVAEVKDNDNVKLWNDDCVYVWLDPGHTHNGDKKYTMIQVSASGAWHDLKNGDPAFNVEGLKVDVARTGTGWTAHLQIPWKGLGEAAPKPGAVWGVNFTRMDQPGKVDPDNMQMSSWVALPFHPGDPADLIRWGHLVFGAKGDAAQAEAGRKAMEKTHQAMTDAAYRKEVLLRNP